MIIKEKKGLQEAFAQLFNNPNRVNFVEFFKNNTGEHNYIDFKTKWIEHDVLARHILGLANSGGGILVIGAKEELQGNIYPIGINEILDKTEIKKKLEKYLPVELDFDVHNFVYGPETEWRIIQNKKFQVLIVEDRPLFLPFVSLGTSNSVCKNRIYYRGKTNTEEATHEELKKILNRRLETQISTKSEDEFRNKMLQLKILYSFIGKKVQMDLSFMYPLQVDNPYYPVEDFDEFVVRMIEKTKKIIENS